MGQKRSLIADKLQTDRASSEDTINLHKNDDSPSLLSYDQLPKWYQDNEYILSAYRPVTYSIQGCGASLFCIHNETANIYTHLLPAVAALCLQAVGQRVFIARYPLASRMDRLVFAFYLSTVILCMGLSATYHTFINHSARYSDLWGRIDYCGIMILIVGDFVTGIYVGFYCEPVLQKLYWTMVSPSVNNAPSADSGLRSQYLRAQLL